MPGKLHQNGYRMLKMRPFKNRHETKRKKKKNEIVEKYTGVDRMHFFLLLYTAHHMFLLLHSRFSFDT